MKRFLIFFLIPAVLIFVISCGDGSEIPSHDFTEITGSGYVTIGLIGANTLYSGYTTYFGASGIIFGQFERIDDYTTVNSDEMNLVLNNSNPIDPFLFMGNDSVGHISCYIDADSSGTLNDNDFLANIDNVFISGDKIIPFTCPGDFNQMPAGSSGTISIQLNGADANFAGNPPLIHVVSGIPIGLDERINDSSLFLDSEPKTFQILNGGTPYLFSGAQIVGNIILVIDVNSNYSIDDGDEFASIKNYEAVSGSTITFTYPDDFTKVSGSGYVTINLKGAYDEHAGKTIMYGCSGIPYGLQEREGGNAVIDSNDMYLPLHDGGGSEFLFTGGIPVRGFGVVIDANSNGETDDGDLVALSEENVVINGDMTITFNY